jgi:hypothetical protein
MDIKAYWNRQHFAIRSDAAAVMSDLRNWPLKTLRDLFGRFRLTFDGRSELSFG